MITMMCVTRADLIHEFACRLTQWPAEVIDRFVSTIRKAIFGVFVGGVVFVALIQGFLCGVGFAIAEVPQPAFWGLIAAFVAPIPFVGTALGCAAGTAFGCGSRGLTVRWPASALPLLCAGRSRGGAACCAPSAWKNRGSTASVVTLILSILCGLAAFGPVACALGRLRSSPSPYEAGNVQDPLPQALSMITPSIRKGGYPPPFSLAERHRHLSETYPTH